MSDLTLSKPVLLHYKSGSSDKLYAVALSEQSPGRWCVAFSYGRRGGTLTPGIKIHGVPYDEAERVYTKLVNEKLSKGYLLKDGGDRVKVDGVMGSTEQVGAVGDGKSPVDGRHPQLLNAIEEAEVSDLLINSAYCMQPKLDGRRVMIEKAKGHRGDVSLATNRKGLPIHLASETLQAIAHTPGIWLMDGELVGTTFHAFDLLQLNGKDLRAQPYKARHLALASLISENDKGPVLVPAAYTATEKRRMMGRLKAENAEGVVFKELAAPYIAGRPASKGPQLKHKFYSTSSAVVGGINGKRSVSLKLLDLIDGWVNVGNCTIPPNKDIPLIDTVVEVRYLYAYKGGSLYQPTYIGPRDDIEQTDCILAQLKYKAEDEEE